VLRLKSGAIPLLPFLAFVACSSVNFIFKISILATYSWKSGGAGIRWLESGAYKAVLFMKGFLILQFLPYDLF
jgi:hypothetical protein